MKRNIKEIEDIEGLHMIILMEQYCKNIVMISMWLQ